MGRLLDIYNEMNKTAEVEQEKKARLEMIQKYTDFAEAELKKTGQEYTEADIEKVADFLIEQDIIGHEEEEKVAEFVEAGKIMAQSFVASLQAQAKESGE